MQGTGLNDGELQLSVVTREQEFQGFPLLLLFWLLLLGGGFSFSLSTTFGCSLGGRLSFFCANAPAEIVVPIKIATRICLSLFITACRLLASTSSRLRERRGVALP
jgi:hypothetical protein